ncbi:MAG: hypothetical protein ACOCW2_01780 [Chitinivibrionales bacterium]
MDPIREGILGLLLFFSHWISPGSEQAFVEAEKVSRADQHYVISCRMDLAWSRQMEQLIDAGIPLRFRMRVTSDQQDSSVFFRTLRFNIVNYTYSFTDSSSDEMVRSKKYPMILLALRDFCRWNVVVSNNTGQCRVEASILPSRAEQLDRFVDMSKIWGRQKVSCVVDPRQQVDK